MLLLLPSPAKFQTPCLAGHLTARNVARFPELTQTRRQLQVKMNQAGVCSGAGQRTVVTIPVVVHVVYKEEHENISDEQIFSQIAVLNQDFRKLNSNAGAVPPIFAPFAADVEFEFCLAGQNPAGQPTNGITRRQTPWSNIGDLQAPDGRPRIHYTELGGTNAWDTQHYLNIWTGKIGGGALGAGTFPGAAPPEEDGVIVDPRYFGTTGLAATSAPHHLGRTATHEIGHYFNLKHIWGGDGNTCDDDDEVADTPLQRSAYLGCPAFPQLSCGNAAMFMNYMDYTDDACMSLFTLGQKTRMWAALAGARPGLIGNPVCSSTATHSPAAGARFRLTPNPAGHTLWIEMEQTEPTPERIAIYDVSGKVRLTQLTRGNIGTIRVDVSDLPAGYYVLWCVYRGEVSEIQPFIKAF